MLDAHAGIQRNDVDLVFRSTAYRAEADRRRINSQFSTVCRVAAENF